MDGLNNQRKKRLLYLAIGVVVLALILTVVSLYSSNSDTNVGADQDPAGLLDDPSQTTLLTLVFKKADGTPAGAGSVDILEQSVDCSKELTNGQAYVYTTDVDGSVQVVIGKDTNYSIGYISNDADGAEIATTVSVENAAGCELTANDGDTVTITAK